MCTHPDRIGQLAREDHHRMLARPACREHCRRFSAERHSGKKSSFLADQIRANRNTRLLPAGAPRRRLARAARAATSARGAGDRPPAGLRQQRHCPGGRRTSRGAAYVARGRERDAR